MASLARAGSDSRPLDRVVRHCYKSNERPRRSPRRKKKSSSRREDLLFTRRQALFSLGTLSSFGVTDSKARASTSISSNDAAEFYAKWRYAEPRDILPFIKDRSERGDPSGVLLAFDEFFSHYPTYHLGREKAEILTGIVRNTKPERCVEIGTFLGFSAIHTASNFVSPEARLVCVEFEPRHAEVARECVEWAGLSSQVEVLVGEGGKRVMDVKAMVGGAADLIFLDHCKPCYLPDLIAMEEAGLVAKGTVVVADNVVYPGAPDYLRHVDTLAGAYKTELLEAKFEYDQVWREDWETPKDAMSYSVRVL